MRRLLLSLLLVLSLAPVAWGQTYYLCSPVTMIDPQGRPIKNASYRVVDINGQVVTTYGSRTGGVTSSSSVAGTLPTVAPAILQFYADPGTYQVTISGGGISSIYNVTCTAPQSTETPGSRSVVVSRAATTWNRGLSSSPALTCPTTGKPCYLQFTGGAGTDQVIETDFISSGLTFDRGILEWSPSTTGAGTVEWEVAWCTYSNGNQPCVPVFGVQTAVIVGTASTVTDQTAYEDVTSAALNPNWPEEFHVVIHAKKDRAATTYSSEARFKNLTLWFLR